jgi:amino-acid N-acetyltransferase
MDAILGILSVEEPEGFLLPITAEELTTHLADFVVATDADRVVGVGRLKRFTESLGEVRTVKVAVEHRNGELGRTLVRALLQRARAARLKHVFALTNEHQIRFFERLGFSVIGKEVLPLKIWADCLACRKRDACDETAMWISL